MIKRRDNEKLLLSRKLLKQININCVTENSFEPVVLTDHPDYTICISPNSGDIVDPPHVDIMRNSDLMRLMDYADRFYVGDEIFDEWEGSLHGTVDYEDIKSLFIDLYFTLTTRDDRHPNLLNLRNLEEYMGAKRRESLKSKLHMIH